MPSEGGPRNIVVKLPRQVGASRGLARTDALARLEELAIGALGKKPEEVRAREYLTSPGLERLEKLVERARRLDRSYEGFDPGEWVTLEVPPDEDPLELEQGVERLDVELAYLEPPPVEPPAVDPTNDPIAFHQTYLDSEGVNAKFVWDLLGGDGSGIGFVDVEQGWNLQHPDLVDHAASCFSGINLAHQSHGTHVLGVVAAVDNAQGAVGIAPETASVRCVSEWRTANQYNRAEAILSAAASMAYGDVLLLETQCQVGQHRRLPVEVLPLCFEAIRLATALGVVVIEAAGNGGEDLDLLPSSSCPAILEPGRPGFRDSGAIMVAASEVQPPYLRIRSQTPGHGTNYGSRIDCFAFGEEVATLDPHGLGIVDRFGGTSSASAIVAGAAISTQGLYQANLGHRLGAIEMRSVLGQFGRPSGEPGSILGLMPDLKRIAEEGPGLPGVAHLLPNS